MRDILKHQLRWLWAYRRTPLARQYIRSIVRDLRELPGLQVRA